MNIILLLCGLALLSVIVADFLLTTIGATAASVLTQHTAYGCFRLLRSILPDRRWARLAIGPMLMTSVASVWIIGVSLGWTLIFQASTRAVVESETGAPQGMWMDLAYIGHILSTLGGELGQPEGTVWALVSVIVAVNGMVILTLSVSFVLTTTRTVTQGRAFLATFDLYRDDVDDMRDKVIPRLPDLIANLNSVPLALYYSCPEESRRMPEGLERLLHSCRGTRNFAALRKVYRDLPRFAEGPDRSDAAFEAYFHAWTQKFRFAQ